MTQDELEILKACLVEAGFEVTITTFMGSPPHLYMQILNPSGQMSYVKILDNASCCVPHFSDPDWIEKLKIWEKTCSIHDLCNSCPLIRHK